MTEESTDNKKLIKWKRERKGCHLFERNPEEHSRK